MVAFCLQCGVIFKKRTRVQMFCSVQCSNRKHLNNKRHIELPKSYSEDLAELFGILLGDGSVTTYFAKVYLNLRKETEYAEYVKKLLSELFPHSVITNSKRESRGTWEIQISSKEVCDYLRKIGFNAKTRKVPGWIIANPLFRKAALRGLFDTEGSVGIKMHVGKLGSVFYEQLTVTNTNKNILNFIETSLLDFGYHPTQNAKANIYISNRLDIKRFLEDIDSHNPKMLGKLRRGA
jgi:hypothetical protein